MAIYTFAGGLTLALLSLGSFPLLAEAQATAAESRAAARALFREGVDLLDSEQWAEAADRFERARALQDSPQIVYNLTTALVEMKQLVRAAELLRGLEREGQAPRAVLRAATARRETIEPRIGQLTIHVTGPRDGVRLQMNGAELAWVMVGVSLPADPVPHAVIAYRSDAAESDEALAQASVTVEEGSEAELLLELPPPPARVVARAIEPEVEPFAVPLDEESPDRGGRRWWIAVVVGVVVVGAGVGLAVGLTRRGEAPPAAGQPTGGVVEFGGGS